MTKNEFELTLFLMGFVKGGENYFKKGSDTWLNKISHNRPDPGKLYKYVYIYPDHYEVHTTSTNPNKTYKQHRGYQRIINYLQRQELFIGITND